MPRKSRIDAADAVHHIIVRGIERALIFRDDNDRANFIKRLSGIIIDTATRCYAWALIPNHFHLLLKTGRVPVSRVMARLLTGYAVSYNRRHSRSGHLFQNRYKSILCQEDVYLLELVRYIHLNPLRAGLVVSIDDLDKYAYCGHGAIIGKQEYSWQDTEGVLRLFSDKVGTARLRYRKFIENGVKQGKRGELTGGGLMRSAGGWANVTAMRRASLFQKSDERILGNGDFVEKVLADAQERMERRHRLKAEGFDLKKVVERVCEVLNIEKSELFAHGKGRRRVAARSLFCYWAVRELNTSQTDLSHMLDISPAAITFSVKRGEELVRKMGYSLL